MQALLLNCQVANHLDVLLGLLGLVRVLADSIILFTLVLIRFIPMNVNNLIIELLEHPTTNEAHYLPRCLKLCQHCTGT